MLVSLCWMSHFLIAMLNVIMLSVVTLSVIMLNVIVLNVIMLNVIMLNVLMTREKHKNQLYMVELVGFRNSHSHRKAKVPKYMFNFSILISNFLSKKCQTNVSKLLWNLEFFKVGIGLSFIVCLHLSHRDILLEATSSQSCEQMEPQFLLWWAYSPHDCDRIIK